MSRYTNEGLMKISEETVDVLFRDIRRRNDEGDLAETLLTEIEQRIEKDNPGFARFMDELDAVFKNAGREEFIPYIATGYYLAYEVFRRQAESNKLRRNG